MAIFFSKMLIFIIVTLLSTILEVSACNGCVQLTEYTFDKLISKFDASLIKFDVAFPYGDKHEAYSQLAKDAKSADNLLIGEVGIKDYGERDNEEIAKQYGVKKDDYPVVKLFLKNKKEPITFPNKLEFTTENLRKFVKEESEIHLSLPGCLPELDKIAFKFIETDENGKKELLKEVENLINEFDKKKKDIAKIYKQIMQRIHEKGASFVKSESDRVKKLLEGKLAADKKKELNMKINILLSFKSKLSNNQKNEL